MPTTEKKVSSDALSQPETRQSVSVLWFGAFLVVLFTSFATILLWSSRQDTIASWGEHLTSFSASAVEHAMQSLDTVQTVLERVTDQTWSMTIDDPERLRIVAASEDMREFMKQRSLETPLIGNVVLVSMEGEVLSVDKKAGTPVYIHLSDPEYFQAFVENQNQENQLFAPIYEMNLKRWVMPLARKIWGAAHKPVGLVFAYVEISYFENFYRSVNLDQDNTGVGLFRMDGTLLARYPYRPDVIGKSFRNEPIFVAMREALDHGKKSAAVITAERSMVDVTDSRDRLVALHTASDGSLMVASSATENYILRNWNRTAWFLGFGVLMVDAVVILMTLWIRGLLKRKRVVIEELAVASRAKTDFLASMSHEIRTPLHGILGMVQLLLASEQPPEQRRNTQIIERSGRMLLSAIDDVLDFSRIEAGRVQFERVPINLHELAQDAVEVFTSRAKEKGLKINLVMDAKLHNVWVEVDPMRLLQIINNLMANALKFTEEGAVTLTIRRQEGNFWWFAVADTGIGMEPQHIKRISEPFVQADLSLSRRKGGMGLGLAIVNRLVRLHQGEMGVESDPGCGSIFWFRLPLTTVPEPDSQAQANMLSLNVAGVEGKRVLVADDNDVNRLIARGVLEKMGMHVIEVEDGAQAAAAFEQHRPDIVLMDLHMPDCDGLEGARRIRAFEAAHKLPRTPMIAITADVAPEDKQDCVDAGMDEVLEKPFGIQKAKSVLLRYMGHQRR